jgi:hypothetical protein
MAGCFEHGGERSGSGATDLVILCHVYCTK